MTDNSRLIEALTSEWHQHIRNGIYGWTSKMMAYNSNKIEGSTLTSEQTASLFDYGQLAPSDQDYRAKDIEEMQGHFLMFNRMLDTLQEPLTESLIKTFHRELKSGVFEDRANGYQIGAYKDRPNIVGTTHTALPAEVPGKMEELLTWYAGEEKTLEVLTQFHVRYESIHPFQDGNGRTGRIILFRECLLHQQLPFIIEDSRRAQYIDGLHTAAEEGNLTKLTELFRTEQEVYRKELEYFGLDHPQA